MSKALKATPPSPQTIIGQILDGLELVERAVGEANSKGLVRIKEWPILSFVVMTSIAGIRAALAQVPEGRTALNLRRR